MNEERSTWLIDYGLTLVLVPWFIAAFCALIMGLIYLGIWIHDLELTYIAPYSEGVMALLALSVFTLVGIILIVAGSIDDVEEKVNP